MRCRRCRPRQAVQEGTRHGRLARARPATALDRGKPTLMGISKRGNAYVRRLLIHGARSCVMHLDRSRNRLGAWLDQLEARMHANKVVVALANKIARIAWVIINRPGTL